MKKLRFIVLGKIHTSYSDISVTFLRGIQSAKPQTIPYTNGNGYAVADGTTLYTEGTINQIGYFRVVSSGTQPVTGNGSLNILVTHYPSDNQGNQSKPFSIDGSLVTINIIYNSKPININLDIEVNNREIKTIQMSNFDGHWSDYDNDSLSFITIYNSNSNLQFNGTSYISGTPIAVSDIQAGKLKYIGSDTDLAYNDDFGYTVTDSNGNTSD